MNAARFAPTISATAVSAAVAEVYAAREESRALSQGYVVWAWEAPYVLFVGDLVLGYEDKNRALARFDEAAMVGLPALLHENPNWTLIASNEVNLHPGNRDGAFQRMFCFGVGTTVWRWWDKQDPQILEKIAQRMENSPGVNPWAFAADWRHFQQFKNNNDILFFNKMTPEEYQSLLGHWDED